MGRRAYSEQLDLRLPHLRTNTSERPRRHLNETQSDNTVGHWSETLADMWCRPPNRDAGGSVPTDQLDQWSLQPDPRKRAGTVQLVSNAADTDHRTLSQPYQQTGYVDTYVNLADHARKGIDNGCAVARFTQISNT